MRDNFITILLFLSCAAINLSCNSRSGKRKVVLSNNIKTTQRDFFNVVKVVDGDTFWVNDGTISGKKIRLIGIDAPESRNSFKKKIGYYGKQAKIYLTNLLAGKSVKLEFDVDQYDQYGRTLAYVFLKDGTFINEEMVKNGYAMVMTVPPNVKYAKLFLKLQQEAREHNRGLWKEQPI